MEVEEILEEEKQYRNKVCLPEWTKSEAKVAIRANFLFKELLNRVYGLLESKESIIFEEYKHLIDMLLFEMKKGNLIDDYKIDIVSCYTESYTMTVSVNFDKDTYKGHCMIMETNGLKVEKDPDRPGFVRFA